MSQETKTLASKNYSVSTSASRRRSLTLIEQSILAQANDKWKPTTLADGVFDLDELKRDISAADAKFAVRKYKATALIMEYLTSSIFCHRKSAVIEEETHLKRHC